MSMPVELMTWVSEAAPNAVKWATGFPRGTDGYGAVSGIAGSRAETILWWSNPVQRGMRVESARLRLTSRAVTGTGSVTVTVQLLAPWVIRFGSTHWANRPTGTVGPTASITKTLPVVNGTVWDFDVAPLLALVAAGQVFSGFRVSTVSGAQVLFDNWGDRVPTLDVVTSTAPAAPTSLSPSGGRAVGVAKPILTWQSGAAIQRVHVRFAATSAGLSPTPAWELDTASTVHQLDLAATTKPALTATAEWWQVRVQGVSGEWSQWSSPASTRFVALPTVTLVSPGATVSDPTPPIDWIADAQVRARAATYVVSGGKATLWEASGYLPSTSTVWLPRRPLTGTGRAVVDVWDNVDREATPGVPTHATVQQDYTFVRSDTVAGISALTADRGTGAPEVTLRWSRTEQPDEWYITRDGRFRARLPGDALVYGSTYRFVDSRVPSGPHTWMIWAIVNGESSPSGAITATSGTTGVWLIDPDNPSERACISGLGLDMATPEVSESLSPVGSRSPVVVTSAQHGLTGTMVGSLVEMPGLTTEGPKQWRETLLDWKPQIGKVVRMLASDRDVPVNLHDISITGSNYCPGEEWNVSFTFHQVDEFEFEEL